jgi:L-asparaginase II
VLTGAVDRFGISESELAVLAASHSAQHFHQDAVLSVLEKAGLDEEALRCGVHPPIHQETAMERSRSGIEPSPVCNNCSGAHAGMLIACRAAGWPIETYGDPDHPLQSLTRHVLSRFSGVPENEIQFAIDNCAVPTFLLPVRNAAQAFARLANDHGMEEDNALAARHIRTAMMAHPHMVAGDARFDSDLMRAAGGSLVSKGGAEGFQGIGLVGEGTGLALKITDGNARAAAPAALRLLDALDALDAPTRKSLRFYAEPEVFNHQGEMVGRVTPVFSIGPVH